MSQHVSTIDVRFVECLDQGSLMGLFDFDSNSDSRLFLDPLTGEILDRD